MSKDVEPRREGQFPRGGRLNVPSASVAEYSYESNAVLRASQLAASKAALSPPVISRRGKEGSFFGAASIATESRPGEAWDAGVADNRG